MDCHNWCIVFSGEWLLPLEKGFYYTSCYDLLVVQVLMCISAFEWRNSFCFTPAWAGWCKLGWYHITLSCCKDLWITFQKSTRLILVLVSCNMTLFFMTRWRFSTLFPFFAIKQINIQIWKHCIRLNGISSWLPFDWCALASIAPCESWDTN